MSRQLVAKSIRNKAREAAERARNVRRAEVVRLKPLTVDLLDSPEVLRESDDFEVSAGVRIFNATYGIKKGDTALLMREGGEWVLFDVIADTKVKRSLVEGDVVDSGGNGGGGAPSGPAGGVLAGTYPNPGFAQDMATQAELNSHEAAKTGVHGFPAMGSGQGLLWDGTNWIATDLATQAELDALDAVAVKDGDAAGGTLLTGTYPNPGFSGTLDFNSGEFTMARQAANKLRLSTAYLEVSRAATSDLALATYKSGDSFNRMHVFADGEIRRGLGAANPAVKFLIGAGSPEGVVTGAPGSVFQRTDGGAGTSFYVKETGTGNTGWVALGTPTDTGGQPRAFAYHNAAQAVGNGTQKILDFNTEVYDTDGMLNPAATNRLTAPSSGMYAVMAAATFATNGTGVRRVALLRHNSAGTYIGTYGAVQGQAQASFATMQATTALMYLDAGDYIQVAVHQFSGGSLDTVAGSATEPRCLVAAVRLSVRSGAPAYVTSLPPSPSDGDEVYFAADAANGVIWHLRYRAASASAYKWEFVGGPPLRAESVANSGGTASTTFVTPTGAVTLTLPLAGDYDITAYAQQMFTQDVFQYGFFSYAVGATAAIDADALVARAGETNVSGGAENQVMSLEFTRRKAIAAAGTVLTPKARASAGPVYLSGNSAGPPWGLRAVPVRVG